MSTVRKSAQYYCRAFISINGRRINYKYIIATNSFMCPVAIFRLYNIEENCLMLHLENFKHNTKCRLINPSNGEMGIVNKTSLEEINNKLNNHLCYIQWRSTSIVIEWFRATEDKKKPCKFIKFDIAES